MHQVAACLVQPPLPAGLLAEIEHWKVPVMAAVDIATATMIGRPVLGLADYAPLDIHDVDDIPRRLYRLNRGCRSTLGVGDPPCKAASTGNRSRNSTECPGEVGAVRHAIEVSAVRGAARPTWNVRSPSANAVSCCPANAPVQRQCLPLALASSNPRPLRLDCNYERVRSTVPKVVPVPGRHDALPALVQTRRDQLRRRQQQGSARVPRGERPHATPLKPHEPRLR